MTKPVSNLLLFVGVFATPSTVFSYLKYYPRVAFPLLLLIIASALVLLGYYSTVDYGWMVEQMIAAQGDSVSAADREEMRSVLTSMPLGATTVISIVGAAIGTTVMLAVVAAYLLLVNKLTDKENFAFPYWLSLVCWASLPGLFSSLISVISILMTPDGQLAIENINPITFNNLLFGLKPTDAFFGPLNTLDPTVVWSTGLLIFGHSIWTGRKVGQSALIVLAPVAVIYTAWFASAMN